MDKNLEIDIDLQPLSRATGFLDPPTEIPTQIYSAYFQHYRPYNMPFREPRSYYLDRDINTESISLLFVCKQTNHETIDILYRKSVSWIDISSGGVEYIQPHKKSLNQRHLSRTCSVQFDSEENASFCGIKTHGLGIATMFSCKAETTSLDGSVRFPTTTCLFAPL